MRRDLALDIQGIVANPSTTIVTYVWLAAFGGSFMECPLCSPTPHGETAWVDDVAADDVAVDDVAVDDSVVEGVGIVISSHHVFHEEVSHEVPYRLPIGAKTR